MDAALLSCEARVRQERPAADTQRQPALPSAVRTPLLSVAISATAGILLDRHADIPFAILFLGIVTASAAWLTAWARDHRRLAIACLWLGTALLGAAWHQVSHMEYANDIGRYATEEGRLVRLRGIVQTDLTVETTPNNDPLRSTRGRSRTTTTLKVTELRQAPDWQEVQGKARLFLAGQLEGVSVGDEVELIGEFHSPRGPGNPGERDSRQHYYDQGIRAILAVKGPEAVSVLRPASRWSLDALLGRLRSSGLAILHERIKSPYSSVASALLLGDSTPLAEGQLDGYLRTGVFHVLAISGQHLVILCAGLWLVLRLLGLSRRRAAWIMAAFVILYALLTGGRPPVVRAAVLVCTISGGVILRRQVQPINSLAFAWLIVALINPSDLFQTGCQLSFISVLVLYEVVRPLHEWATTPRDGLSRLLEELQPWWQRLLIRGGSWLWWGLLTSLVVWLATAPLVATRYNVLPPIAIVISPFLVFLASIALLAGFLLLSLGPISGVLQDVLGWTVETSLYGCDRIVKIGEQVPGGYWYTCGLPEWWLWGYYLGLLAVLLWPKLRTYWKAATILALGWLALGLWVQLHRPIESGLRCTFLAVGHGGCIVMETPDGRTLLYDAGSMGGPEVTARQIAPFLWSRGISRIDEVFISHADLDHFNGLPALLDRFRIGQVSLTPTFAEKPEPGVQFVCKLFEDRHIPTRILSAGQGLQAVEVSMTVLHPPETLQSTDLRLPLANENARSMVLLIEYGGHTLLLTGDLEPPGLEYVINKYSCPLGKVRSGVDVLLAPHHGSPFSNTEAFARWARPGLAISSEGRPHGRRPDPYSKHGGILWRTWQEGAVTVRLDETSIHAETFRTEKHWTKGK